MPLSLAGFQIIVAAFHSFAGIPRPVQTPAQNPISGGMRGKTGAAHGLISENAPGRGKVLCFGLKKELY
ncbi:hypothetical protein [Aliiroseovarius crassostreae]|uniref:hypothetical protein n=1 Tax=Aliiroseovarius crassostreae TaxID=154981 RepID=UPI003C7CBEA9